MTAVRSTAFLVFTVERKVCLGKAPIFCAVSGEMEASSFLPEKFEAKGSARAKAKDLRAVGSGRAAQVCLAPRQRAKEERSRSGNLSTCGAMVVAGYVARDSSFPIRALPLNLGSGEKIDFGEAVFEPRKR